MQGRYSGRLPASAREFCIVGMGLLRSPFLFLKGTEATPLPTVLHRYALNFFKLHDSLSWSVPPCISSFMEPSCIPMKRHHSSCYSALAKLGINQPFAK